MVKNVAVLFSVTLINASQSLTHPYGFDGKLRASTKSASTKKRFRTSEESEEVTPTYQDERYVRWSQDESRDCNSQVLALQTAVTTWKKNDFTIQLHAQVHLGSKSYYDYYMADPLFDSTTVLYELLVDEEQLQVDQRSPILAGLQNPVQASSNDQSLALQYGWECQANVIDYVRRNWYHADWTRKEYSSKDTDPIVPSSTEAATALLVGPPLSADLASRRRIFTNLFLPGNYFALVLRAVLWMAVPSPELSILLLDWSSTWQDEGTKSSKGKLSPIAQVALQSLATGHWMTARRLVFGQVLLAGHKTLRATRGATIVGRNDRALEVVDAAFEHLGAREVCLLYGCNHCPDLHRKLQNKGFSRQETEWRTVWSISNDDMPPNNSSWRVPIATAIACYLGIDGADWIGTFQEIFSSPDVASSGLAILLYLLRHVGLYLGMSKFLLDIDELATNKGN